MGSKSRPGVVKCFLHIREKQNRFNVTCVAMGRERGAEGSAREAFWIRRLYSIE